MIVLHTLVFITNASLLCLARYFCCIGWDSDVALPYLLVVPPSFPYLFFLRLSLIFLRAGPTFFCVLDRQPYHSGLLCDLLFHDINFFLGQIRNFLYCRADPNTHTHTSQPLTLFFDFLQEKTKQVLRTYFVLFSKTFAL